MKREKSPDDLSEGSATEPTEKDKRRLEAFKNKRKKLFEFEGRYDDIPDDNNILALFNKLNGKVGKSNRRATLLAQQR